MYTKIFLTALAINILIDTTESIVCTPSICASVSCQKIELCDGDNKVIKPGGFCNCCDFCYTILKENDECNSLNLILQGVPPPLQQCGEGLICYEGKCRSFEALGKPILKE